jgi:hypothetical protein
MLQRCNLSIVSAQAKFVNLKLILQVVTFLEAVSCLETVAG